MSSDSEIWTQEMVTGGRPVFSPYSSSCASIFSKDGKYDLVFMTHQIRVYFVSTRQCIRTINIEMKDVVDFKLDDADDRYLLVFKGDGEIVTVNWKDKNVSPIVSSTKIDCKSSILTVIKATKDFFFLMTGKRDKKVAGSPHTRFIVRVNRENNSSVILMEVSNVLRYALSPNSSNIGYLLDNSTITVVNLENYLSGLVESAEANVDEESSISSESITYVHRSAVTSIAISNQRTVALGTHSGTIQLIYESASSTNSQSLLKWHIDECSSLFFSPNDKYLLSGGLEKVLVIWSLDSSKPQFLPRLNGTIEKIGIDENKAEYYNLLLKVSSSYNESLEDTSLEVLSVSAVDLLSRISINAIRPHYASNLKHTLSRTQKKFNKAISTFDKSNLRYDYSSMFEIHPKTNHLYFPNEAMIQVYDLVKNEQSFLQTAASVIQTGKVRSEKEIADPTISLLSFSADGEWMCTFDSVSNSEMENLLSKNERQYSLKFWKFIETTIKSDGPINNSNRTGYWELTTKIVDPHGPSNPILSISSAPVSFFQGLAFLTADDTGAVRIWRPRIPKEMYQGVKVNGKPQQTAWTLRKASIAGIVHSDAVDTCWSYDGSLVFVSHGNNINILSSQTLEKVPDFAISSLCDSEIRSISLIDENLIVLSKNSICSFNLLSNRMNHLYGKINTGKGGKNLIAVNQLNKTICLAVNYYDFEGSSSNFSIKSKIYLFKYDQLAPIHVSYHSQGVSSIRALQDSFLFVDLDYRVGLLCPSGETESMSKSTPSLLFEDINRAMMNANSLVSIIDNNSAVPVMNAVNNSLNKIDSTDLKPSRLIDSHTFLKVFEDAESKSVENIFDEVIRIIN